MYTFGSRQNGYQGSAYGQKMTRAEIRKFLDERMKAKEEGTSPSALKTSLNETHASTSARWAQTKEHVGNSTSNDRRVPVAYYNQGEHQRVWESNNCGQHYEEALHDQNSGRYVAQNVIQQKPQEYEYGRQQRQDQYRFEQPRCSGSFDRGFPQTRQDDGHANQRRNVHYAEPQEYFMVHQQRSYNNWDHLYDQQRERPVYFDQKQNTDQYREMNQLWDRNAHHLIQNHYVNQNPWNEKPHEDHHQQQYGQQGQYWNNAQYLNNGQNYRIEQQNQWSSDNQRPKQFPPVSEVINEGEQNRREIPFNDNKTEDWEPTQRVNGFSQNVPKAGLFSKFRKVAWEDRNTEESDREEWIVRYQRILDWLDNHSTEDFMENSHTESTASSSAMPMTEPEVEDQQQWADYEESNQNDVQTEIPHCHQDLKRHAAYDWRQIPNGAMDADW